MTVYKKLQGARHELSKANLKKTGHNSYGGWFYYELGDFIPTVHKLFDEVGLCGVVTFGETATLTIYDAEGDGKIEFSTPIVYAEAAKGQPIQMLGSTHTYLRRYLWLLAMELVEADAVDSAQQQERSEPIKIAPKAVKPPAKIEGKEGEWQLKIKTNPEADLQGWIDIVRQSVGIMLSAAKDEKDVMDIFKNNRVIFDRLKADSLDDHVDIMADFKKAKDGFKKEPA